MFCSHCGKPIESVLPLLPGLRSHRQFRLRSVYGERLPASRAG